jgi:LacI family transcriptional regulator
MLPGALRAIAGRRLELPRELSLVTCDDTILAELYRPPIAVVKRDNFEIGRIAAEVLIGRLQGEDVPRDVYLTTEFLARESCAPPREGER